MDSEQYYNATVGLTSKLRDKLPGSFPYSVAKEPA